MISTLQGTVQSIGDDQVILELGGIGLRVNVPLARLERIPKVGESTFLFTYLVVREDALDLYGFPQPEARRIFEHLLTVSGIGPRLALAMLSQLSPEVIQRSIASDQPEILTQVSGIGRKTAEKVVFELKDVLGEPGLVEEAPTELESEVLEVLTSLGYSVVEARSAIQSVPEGAPEDIEARVRQALRYFARP